MKKFKFEIVVGGQEGKAIMPSLLFMSKHEKKAVVSILLQYVDEILKTIPE